KGVRGAPGHRRERVLEHPYDVRALALAREPPQGTVGIRRGREDQQPSHVPRRADVHVEALAQRCAAIAAAERELTDEGVGEAVNQEQPRRDQLRRRARASSVPPRLLVRLTDRRRTINHGLAVLPCPNAVEPKLDENPLTAVLYSGQPRRPVQRDLGDPLIVASGRREHTGEATQSPDLPQAGCASHRLEPARELGRSRSWSDLELGVLAERLLVLHELLVLLPAEVTIRRAQARDAILDRGHELVFG